MRRAVYYAIKHEIRLYRGAALRNDDPELEAFAQELERKYPFNILARPSPRVRTLAQRVDDKWGIPY